MKQMKKCEKLRVLLVSSESPFKYSSQMALDIVAALEEGGHKVNLLTKYADERLTPAMKSVLDSPEPRPARILGWAAALKRVFPFLRKWHKPAFMRSASVRHTEGYLIFDRDETEPPLPVEQVIGKITQPYDLVIVLFWQNLLTSRTIKAIYEKLGSLILFMAVDMGPLTGGCHYFWNCRNFRTGCGRCPAIDSPDRDDFTSKNFSFKQQMYASIRCVFLGNTWMNEHARQSALWRDKPSEVVYPVINEKQFQPLAQTALLKQHFGIDGKYNFILFAGSCFLNDKRKGFTYLAEAFSALGKMVSSGDLRSVALVFAGRVDQSLQSLFPVKVYQLNYLDFADLTKMYALADVYLSPSIQDAGPMMVNQALMCGTPVVAFDIGVATDLVRNDQTGYKAVYKDASDFAAGIRRMLRKSPEEKEQMAQMCRQVALQTCSYAEFRSRIEKCYARYHSY